jgi:hypothetical protein
VLYDAEKQEWAKTTISDPLYSLRIDRLGVISNRWKTRDAYITCRFSTLLGWLFVGNLSCGRRGRITLPKHCASELSEGAQNVLRELRFWRKPRPYPQPDMASLVGTKAERVTDQKKAIKSVLDELEEKKYIPEPKIVGRGRKTCYYLSSNV